MDDDIAYRIRSLGKVDLGVPGSELYTRMDGQLSQMVAEAAMDSAVNATTLKKVLVTSAVGPQMFRVLRELFPSMDMVIVPMSQPIGMEIEVLRDVMVQKVMGVHPCRGEVIHVGGTADQHVPYGRKVHCEYPQVTIGAQAAYRRRQEVLYGLYKEKKKVTTALGADTLPYALYDDHINEVACNPVRCTRKAAFMLFDLLTCPLSQTQVCAAMALHKCDIAEVMVPVEDQSFGGAAGLIPGTTIRAVYDPMTDLIHYDTRMGRVEFSPTPRAIVVEFMHVAAKVFAGYTYKFEIQEAYGFFQRVVVTRVEGVFAMEVRHSTWIGPDVDRMRVTVPVLKALGLDADDPRNYFDASVTVDKHVYNTAYTYAMSLERKQMSVALIRTKVASVNDRVVIKGTTVELKEPLDTIVLDVVSMGVFLCAYEDRFRAAESFSAGSQEVEKLKGMSKASVMRDVLGAAAVLASRLVRGAKAGTVDKLVGALDRVYANNRQLSTTSVKEEVLRKDFVSIIFGSAEFIHNWVAPVFNPYGPAALLNRCWSNMQLADVYDDVELGKTVNAMYHYDGDRAGLPNDRFTAYELAIPGGMELLDPEIPGGQVIASHQEDAARLLLTHTDAGPDNAGDLRYDRQRYDTSGRVDVALKAALMVRDPNPVLTLSESYTIVFPKVAKSSTMRYDMERFEEGTADFAINAYYMRFPVDSLVPKPAQYYKSRLVGPDRPNARPSSRNMLAALAKRNVDANVIKAAEEANLAQRVWTNFKTTYCRPDIDAHLKKLREQPIEVGFKHFLAWVNNADPGKVKSVVETLLDRDTQLLDLPLNEFVAMFKGQVKPTLSSSAHKLYAKFQTIVYYADKTVNAIWSPIMMDVASRFESCLAPQIYVALRGDRKMREDHLSAHWPYGEKDFSYIQVDISEYDKSQESRTRALEDLIFRELGMSSSMVDTWSHNHKDTIIRCLALGIKLAVSYQRKSGDATTALGNVMLNMMTTAFAFARPVVSISQGDDGLIIAPGSAVNPQRTADIFAQVFNLPVKVIVQKVTVAAIPYAMSCFYVPHNDERRVYVVPDPVRAIEGLSKPMAHDEDKFDEKWVSFQDRVNMWKAPYPMEDLQRMVREWYSAPQLDVELMVNALISLGANKTAFRYIWEESLGDM